MESQYYFLSVMERDGIQSRRHRTAALLIVLAAAGIASARPGGRPGTVGRYELTFDGDFHGTGSGRINPVHLNVNATLDGPSGQVALSIRNLRIDDGKFDGDATIGGQPAHVFGRVDGPEGGLVREPRLVLILKTNDGKVARAFGGLRDQP